MRYLAVAALVAVLIAGLSPNAAAQVFYPDDPVAVDPDRASVPQPVPQPLSDYYDYYENAVLNRGNHGGRATNINTLGDVPRSSWYTPRHYDDRMSITALREGPMSDDGPDAQGPWRVVGGKSEGKTPGLTVVDSSGDRYLLKFDAAGFMELSTGAEAIATRIVYALGYHVPENYLVRFARDRLAVTPGATFVGPSGTERPLDAAAIDRILGQVARYPDGTYRALASRFISGIPLGPFQYHGTRPDDGNDLFLHEMRRELRGFRVAAAWLHHDDSRSVNSLDMFVTEDGQHFVRHYLIDFGTTFGGGPLGPKGAWTGREHIVEFDTVLLSALTFGMAGRPWIRESMPDLTAVGRYRMEHFSPEAWRPQYRNPAFANMDADDAFWMAKQVAHFTDTELRALVETGQYTEPRVTDYLTRALVARRDQIAAAYLQYGGGLDRFAVTGARLTFDDVWAAHARRTGNTLSPAYRVRWFAFDNRTGRRSTPLGQDTLAVPVARLPQTTAGYIVGAFQRIGHPGTTEVYVRMRTQTVVGVRRHAAGLPDTVPVWTVIPGRRPAGDDAESKSSPDPSTTQ